MLYSFHNWVLSQLQSTFGICVNPIPNRGLQILPTREACPYLIQKYSDWPVIDQEYNSVREFFYNFWGVCSCKSFENELKK